MGTIRGKHPEANKQAPKMVLFLLACIACALTSIDLPGAEERSEELVIAGDEPLGVQARHLQQIYPEIRAHVEDTLGWKFRSPPTGAVGRRSRDFRENERESSDLSFRGPFATFHCHSSVSRRLRTLPFARDLRT